MTYLIETTLKISCDITENIPDVAELIGIVITRVVIVLFIEVNFDNIKADYY